MAHDVVGTEVIVWIDALYFIVPDVDQLLPCYGQHRRILLKDRLSLADQRQSLRRIELAVDLIG